MKMLMAMWSCMIHDTLCMVPFMTSPSCIDEISRVTMMLVMTTVKMTVMMMGESSSVSCFCLLNRSHVCTACLLGDSCLMVD